MATNMKFKILGSLEVWSGGLPVRIPGPQRRGVLTVLLLNANHVVSADRLVAHVWGEHAPANARRLLQGCVAKLRGLLQVESAGTVRQPLQRSSPGYVLQVQAGELDLHRFDDLFRAAQDSAAIGTAASLERASWLLSEALMLWRGPAIDGVALPGGAAQLAELAERRTAALEERIDVDLRLGRERHLVGELQRLVADEPMRERCWAQLMVALARSDRRADALAAYRSVRGTLVEQLGVEPSPLLQRLHQVLLAGGDALPVYLPAAVVEPPRWPAPVPAAAPPEPVTASGGAKVVGWPGLRPPDPLRSRPTPGQRPVRTQRCLPLRRCARCLGRTTLPHWIRHQFALTASRAPGPIPVDQTARAPRATSVHGPAGQTRATPSSSNGGPPSGPIPATGGATPADGGRRDRTLRGLGWSEASM
jgi:DNA-binding SARP family transcriptional activator